jgi:hypothetical protein
MACRSTDLCNRAVDLPVTWNQTESNLTHDEATPIIDVAARFIMKRCRVPLDDLMLVGLRDHNGLPAVHILKARGLGAHTGPGPQEVSNAILCIAVVDPRESKVVEFWTAYP